MKKYEILSHPSDLKIKVFGKTKEELFLNSLLAMEANLKPETSGEKVERKIEVKSMDEASLLVDFLNGALSFSLAKKEAYTGIKFKKICGDEIEATLKGNKVERFGEDIKAATHHNLEIRITDEGWEATILFDV